MRPLLRYLCLACWRGQRYATETFHKLGSNPKVGREKYLAVLRTLQKTGKNAESGPVRNLSNQKQRELID